MHPKKHKTSKKMKIWVDLETEIECTVSPTFRADIYVGLKPGYDSRIQLQAFETAKQVCQQYCDEIGLGVTIEHTEFIYTNGNEPGIKVGLINYPRYPSTEDEIVGKALRLAENLKRVFQQHRVSVVTSNLTYMLGDLD